VNSHSDLVHIFLHRYVTILATNVIHATVTKKGATLFPKQQHQISNLETIFDTNVELFLSL